MDTWSFGRPGSPVSRPVLTSVSKRARGKSGGPSDVMQVKRDRATRQNTVRYEAIRGDGTSNLVSRRAKTRSLGGKQFTADQEFDEVSDSSYKFPDCLEEKLNENGAVPISADLLAVLEFLDLARLVTAFEDATPPRADPAMPAVDVDSEEWAAFGLGASGPPPSPIIPSAAAGHGIAELYVGGQPMRLTGYNADGVVKILDATARMNAGLLRPDAKGIDMPHVIDALLAQAGKRVNEESLLDYMLETYPDCDAPRDQLERQLEHLLPLAIQRLKPFNIEVKHGARHLHIRH